MPEHKIVSREAWIVARKELLKKEKESARPRDQLAADCSECDVSSDSCL